MPLADIPAESALVGSKSVAIARQPVGLIVEHVVALRAVGHASTVLDDVALSACPPPTANQTLDPTAWAFLFFSEFSVIRHIISPVESSPAHAAGQLGRSSEERSSAACSFRRPGIGRRSPTIRGRFYPRSVRVRCGGRVVRDARYRLDRSRDSTRRFSLSGFPCV